VSTIGAGRSPRSAGQRRPRSLRASLTAFAIALLVAPSLAVGVPVALPAAAATAAAATLESGFTDETLVTGLDLPTAVAFAPDGRVFVTEKAGVVRTWPSIASFQANLEPSQTIDIRADVMDYWDRGLLGIAVAPDYPTNPSLYLLYTYDRLPGQTAADPPRWTGNPDHEQCPTAPGGNTDGCVVLNRLDKITVDPATGASTARTELLSGWCQQFPSHSAGSVAFGADGMLYVSAGEGASFNGGAEDYGQKGGTLPDTTNPITPRNPCGDPPGAPGDLLTAPTAEGGALRSQSFRRPASESAVLNGTVLRLNPVTGAAAAGNPAIGNADPIRRRIVAYGLRNPFRIAFRPGTNDLYIGDVGFNTWEEVNRLSNPTAGPTNFGWPCFEGPLTGTYYQTSSLALCSTLSAGSVVSPLFDYSQNSHMVANDGCPPIAPATRAGASVSGLAFATGTAYPEAFRGALFVADYSRNCIVVLPDRGDGVPSGTAVKFESAAANPVMLVTEPAGNILYVDLNGGAIHRIRYQPPVASFSATPSSGPAPLTVAFDGRGSSAIAGITSWSWDFGDGSPAGSGSTVAHQYAGGTYTATLTVTDGNGATATKSRTIAADNTPPVLTLDAPTCTTSCWAVGDTINLAAHATDAQDGALPASAFAWHVGLLHCHSVDDCHEHDLLDPTGVDETSFVAPDHDAGSFLRISVTATDSGGLQDTATIDVKPKTSPVTVKTSPGGLPVSLDGETGTGQVGPVDLIEGHTASVSAPATSALGEDLWTFDHWSDGGAATHTVTVGTAAQTLTATYTKTTTDAPDTCAAAPIQAVTGTWSTGRFGKTNDVDWIRFTVPKTGTYRFVLGDLPLDGTLSLYRGCSTLLATSNHSGPHWEELISSLVPGTYALRMASASGASSADSHRWLMTRLASAITLVSSRSVSATSIRLVGEVINTTAGPRSVTVTARLYSSGGTLLKTITGHPFLAVLGPKARSTFVLKSDRPAGVASIRYTFTSSAATRATRILSTKSVVGSSPGTGSWKVTGKVVNTSSTTATGAAFGLTLLDAVGSVVDATSGAPAPTTLARGASASFTFTFSGLTVLPQATAARARAR
jgi:glucose/arabinose dehydrogenase/PKD repeat protein